MKVLWFSNTPANADEYFNSKLKSTGGWLKSLDQLLQDEVELHVAFYSNLKEEVFKYKKTTYHPIYLNKQSKLKVYLSRLRKHVIDKEFLNNYLEIIERVNPDLVHIHGTENSFGYIIDQIAIPVVISIQGNLTVYQHKYFSGIEEKYAHLSNNILTKILGYTPYNTKYWEFVKKCEIEKNILKNCKYIIGRTDWDRRITKVLAPNSKYYYCSEILRPSFYNKVWKHTNNKTLTIFTTNGKSFYKGIETICQTLSLLNKKLNFDLKWRVAGIDSNDLLVKILKKKLKGDFPSENLELLGNLAEEKIINNLLEADIYVMPSHIENSPNNLCEAMLLGLPCIATDAGGTSSILTNNNTGILIQDGDPWSMAGAILELSENAKRAVELGSAAREIALKRHDKNKIVSDLIGNYKKIIDSYNVPINTN